MVEIIDLLSSSPLKPQTTGVLPDVNTTSPGSNVFEFDLSDFGSTGNLDFEFEQPSKRQRLSLSPVQESLPGHEATKQDLVFDLSSDGDVDGLSVESKAKAVGSIVTNDKLALDSDDEFRFSSSAPDADPVQRSRTKDTVIVLDLSSDHEADTENCIQHSSRLVMPSKPLFTQRTANLLAGLTDASDSKTQKGGRRTQSKRGAGVDTEIRKIASFKKVTKHSAAPKDDIIDSSQPEAKTKSMVSKLSQNLDSADIACGVPKALSKAAKDAAKEAEKERKRLDKEQKAQEKQRAAHIAEANKSKTNKKNSTPEMIIDMPPSLQGLSVGNQVEEYMKQLEVKVTFSDDDEVSLTNDTEVTFGNMIRWRRKVAADYDGDLEIWKPLPKPRVTRENHIMVYLKAEDFVSLAVVGQSSRVKSASEVSESAMKANMDAHVASLRSRYRNCTIIYLIEGLSSWNRKAQTAKNRAYTAAVRSQVLEDGDVPDPSSLPHVRPKPTKRKQKAPQADLSSVSPDTTENILMHLQLHHQPLLIHHTTSPATTAAQISVLTQHLSTRPYRLAEQSHNLASASFCMATGQIRTGATPHEVYINMLQEVNRVTPSMAYGISNSGYGTVGRLVKGFREHGNLVLEDVRKSVNVDGGWSERRLGPMVSRRLCRVWTGRDPGSRDGMA